MNAWGVAATNMWRVAGTNILGVTATNIWIVGATDTWGVTAANTWIVGATDTLGVTVANTWGIAAAILGGILIAVLIHICSWRLRMSHPRITYILTAAAVPVYGFMWTVALDPHFAIGKELAALLLVIALVLLALGFAQSRLIKLAFLPALSGITAEALMCLGCSAAATRLRDYLVVSSGLEPARQIMDSMIPISIATVLLLEIVRPIRMRKS